MHPDQNQTGDLTVHQPMFNQLSTPAKATVLILRVCVFFCWNFIITGFLCKPIDVILVIETLYPEKGSWRGMGLRIPGLQGSGEGGVGRGGIEEITKEGGGRAFWVEATASAKALGLGARTVFWRNSKEEAGVTGVRRGREGSGETWQGFVGDGEGFDCTPSEMKTLKRVETADKFLKGPSSCWVWDGLQAAKVREAFSWIQATGQGQPCLLSLPGWSLQGLPSLRAAQLQTSLSFPICKKMIAPRIPNSRPLQHIGAGWLVLRKPSMQVNYYYY